MKDANTCQKKSTGKMLEKVQHTYKKELKRQEIKTYYNEHGTDKKDFYM